MSDLPDEEPATTLPPDLRFLKILVTTLAAVMIVGLVAIVALLVIRLQQPDPLPQLPAAITLPEGAQAEAVTFARNYTVVVTDGGQVLVYDKAGQKVGDLTLGTEGGNSDGN
ncbi:hypothetical protein B6V75_01540 [Thioclava sp. F1Mire-8]|uniref:DUF6476 family protein n=1 Tax=Thioclava sp. F1Mire-8 TaxID=1973006 RepID=UPI000B547652|nr:DUF6476 family protein [Thioclava sp. F1Mire-8]OWY04857.1 hypothetical protein B6V75_01540 [Thioclava sp. F1Mire-8]